MNWKTTLRASDLDDNIQLELTCRLCGAVRYLNREDILARNSGAQLFMDEVEKRTKCRQRGCGGTMRMVMVRKGDTSGFVGGIA